jgi:hypothetical protein
MFYLSHPEEMRETSLDGDGDLCQISTFKEIEYYMAFDWKDLEVFLGILTWPDVKETECESMDPDKAREEKMTEICYALELAMQLAIDESVTSDDF